MQNLRNRPASPAAWPGYIWPLPFLGYVQLVSEAQPYVMGYFGVVQTVLSKKYGFTGFSIDTGGGIVDATNIGAVSAFAKQGLR